MVKEAAEDPPASLEDSELVNMDLDDIVAGTRKLVAINRGDAKPDERDAFGYKRIYSTGDLIGERIKIDAGKPALTLLRKLNKRRSLKNLPAGFLTSYSEGQLIGNPLSSPIEETNPLQVQDHMYRITQMGPGGIGSSNALTEEMQNVHASEFGFIDPIAGPECFPGTHSVLTDRGWILWPDVKETDRLVTHTEDNQVLYETPERLVCEEYAGPMVWLEGGGIYAHVTPSHRVWHLEETEERLTPRFTRAGDLKIGDELLIPTGLVGVGKLEYRKVLVQEAGEYFGNVYCAAVPSGLLYVRGDQGVPFWSGNSEKAGIDVRATHNSRMGSDGRIYQKWYNPRRNRYEWHSARDLLGKTIGVQP